MARGGLGPPRCLFVVSLIDRERAMSIGNIDRNNSATIGKYRRTSAWSARGKNLMLFTAEHPLGKREVVSSILTGSTRKSPSYQDFNYCAPPCPRAANVNGFRSPDELENPGSLSDQCSVESARADLRACIASKPARLMGHAQASRSVHAHRKSEATCGKQHAHA
jgi:hypothetical protein